MKKEMKAQVKQLNESHEKILKGIREDIKEHNKAIDSLVEDYQKRTEWYIEEFKRQINKLI